MGIAGASALLACVYLALRRVPVLIAAEKLDASHKLHDRISSAVLFAAEKEPTELMQLAMADANGLRDLSPARAVPFELPKAWPMVPYLSAAMLLLSFFEVRRYVPRMNE